MHEYCEYRRTHPLTILSHSRNPRLSLFSLPDYSHINRYPPPIPNQPSNVFSLSTPLITHLLKYHHCLIHNTGILTHGEVSEKNSVLVLRKSGRAEQKVSFLSYHRRRF